MATRQKKTLIQGITAEQANDAFANYAKADAQISKINADIELQCAKIREKRADELTRLSDEREKAFDTLQAYAVENQAELFTKKKSLDMTHGTIGFRTGTPKLKTLKGFTWASALNLVKRFLPDYIRIDEEIAKDKMLADRNNVVPVERPNGKETMAPLTEAMAQCGIMVTQDETFFVEPKKEEAA